MMVHTDIPEAPWFVVERAKQEGRSANVINHFRRRCRTRTRRCRRLLPIARRRAATCVRPSDTQTIVPDFAAHCSVSLAMGKMPLPRRAWCALGAGGSVGLAAASAICRRRLYRTGVPRTLTVVLMLASYGWLRKERGPVGDHRAVAGIQLLSHVAFSVGHTHPVSTSMLAGHALPPSCSRSSLRWGEARAFAVARRRYSPMGHSRALRRAESDRNGARRTLGSSTCRDPGLSTGN